MPPGVVEPTSSMPDITNRPYHFVDEELIGDIKIQLDIVTPAVFFAGSLQEVILSAEFVRVPLEVQEMVKHLSFLAHLMIKYDDFHVVHRLHTKLMAEFYSQNRSWNDTKYLKNVHNNLKTLLETGCDVDGHTYLNGDQHHSLSDNQKEEREISTSDEYKKEVDFPEAMSLDEDGGYDLDTKDDLMTRLDQDDSFAQTERADVDQSFEDGDELPAGDTDFMYDAGGSDANEDDLHQADQPKPKRGRKKMMMIKKKIKKINRKLEKVNPKLDGGEGEDKEDIENQKPRRTRKIRKTVKHKRDPNVEHEVPKEPHVLFCPECNKEVQLAGGETIKDHFREHHPIMFTCPHCSFSRKSPISMNKHIQKEHPNEKEVKILCPHCGEVSNTFKGHVAHVQKFHINILVCPHCPNICLSEHKLKLHKEKEHNIVEEDTAVREICPFCGKLMKDLYAHIWSVHTERKPQKCSLCDYTSGHPSAVKLHFKRTHMVKPSVCPKCNKTVKFLEAHLKRSSCGIPTEERKKVNCEHCGKGFTTNTHLKTHVKSVHLNAKDIECPNCEYKTTKKFNLDIHIRRVHEGKDLTTECHFCGKQVFSLDSHVKAYHQEELITSSGYTYENISQMKMVTEIE